MFLAYDTEGTTHSALASPPRVAALLRRVKSFSHDAPLWSSKEKNTWGLVMSCGMHLFSSASIALRIASHAIHIRVHYTLVAAAVSGTVNANCTISAIWHVIVCHMLFPIRLGELHEAVARPTLECVHDGLAA